MNEWVIKIKLFGTSTKEINVTRLLIKKYIKLVFQRSGGIILHNIWQTTYYIEINQDSRIQVQVPNNLLLVLVAQKQIGAKPRRKFSVTWYRNNRSTSSNSLIFQRITLKAWSILQVKLQSSVLYCIVKCRIITW